MLSILAFKKSLFAGVLDGGPSEVLLGGSRLKRFMESVEAVTTAAAGPTPEALPPAARPPLVVREATPIVDSARRAVVQDLASPPGHTEDLSRLHASSAGAAETLENRPPPAASWASLLTAGLKLVESLTAASSGNGDGAAASSSRWIETDAQTGRAYMKLPVPDAQALQTLGDALSRLVSSLPK